MADKDSTPEQIAQRIKSLRALSELSREQLSIVINVSAATIRLWENPRKNSKGLQKKACEKLIAGFKKINIIFSREWLYTGVGTSPYIIQEGANTISKQGIFEKVNSRILTRSRWEELKSKIPSLVPKKDYSLVSSGTFGIKIQIFGFGKTKVLHNPLSTITFGIVPATYFKKVNVSQIDVLCEISESIASIFAKYNKTITPSILTRVTMETYQKVYGVTNDPNIQISIIDKFISTIEDGIKIDRQYLSTDI